MTSYCNATLVLALLALPVWGCGNKDGPRPAGRHQSPPTPDSDAAPSSEPVEQTQSAASVRFDGDIAPLLVSTHDGDGPLLIASGPPGGVLLLEVWRAGRGDQPAQVLRQHAEREAAAAPGQAIIGEAGTADFRGTRVPALAWISGESMARTHSCALLVDAGQDRLLVRAAVSDLSSQSPSCDLPLAHPQITRALGRLVID